MAEYPLVKVHISRPDSKGNMKLSVFTLESYSGTRGATYRETGPIPVPKPVKK